MMMGNVPADRLAFPRDLRAWRQWQEGTHPLRLARTRLTAQARAVAAAHLPAPAASRFGTAPAPLHLSWRGEHPAVLLALDALTPTQLAAVLAPLEHLGSVDVAVVSTQPVVDVATVPGEDGSVWRSAPLTVPEHRPDVLDEVRAVVATGNYLPAGAAAHRWARSLDATPVVVQHGLLTPFAPPLPPDCLLLAFSEEDADFHTRHRRDTEVHVIGSQLLWSASRPERRAPTDAHDRRPVFLGQLHGAELPRPDVARAARTFCEVTGALYRPHPGERDRLSRAQHAVWRARGLAVDDAGAALTAVDAPVGSVFSTGVLEAAARGLPARVTHPAPPRWLEAFWQRYGMVRWDGTASGAGAATERSPATPPPPVPGREPARAVAAVLHRAAGAVMTPNEPEEAP